MAELNEDQQAFIVTRLACYATPSKVRDMLKVRWPELAGIPLAQICYYNPLGAQGYDLHEKWVDLFHTVRDAHKAKLAAVPIAEQAYRLSRYQELIDDELVSQSPKMVLRALEQAAKDIGGMYTRPSEDKEVGDPNAIPKALEDGLEKVYGTPDTDRGSQSPDGAVAADVLQPATPGP